MAETQNTGKNKKTALNIAIVLIVLIIIAGTIGYLASKENNKEDASRLNQLYESLKSKDSYSFETTLNDDNKMYYATKEDKAYINTIYHGDESKFIIRDGNTYLIIDDRKTYYTYNNNQTNLNKIELEFNSIKNLEHITGKEKIENKTYQYEEYDVLTTFAMMNASNIGETEKIKTRFYFKGDNLVYIKTIIGQKEELLKADISYNIDEKLFEIPSNYKEN